MIRNHPKPYKDYPGDRFMVTTTADGRMMLEHKGQSLFIDADCVSGFIEVMAMTVDHYYESAGIEFAE